MADLVLSGPDESYVRVIEDSISAHTGDRVTSFEVNGWRFTLAEWNTHGLFVRNSASSRAIPVEKQLERYLKAPAYPHAWTCEQRGMSGGSELGGDDYLDALRLWDAVHSFTYGSVRNYVDAHPDKERRLHKSLLNRLLEPMQWHLMLITASSYENFFDQRCHPAAQPELRVCAELMKDLHAKSDPVELRRGEWHTPYITPGDRIEVTGLNLDVREVSTARCARTSYMTQNGQRDPFDDVRLYNETLLGGQHMSPFSHVATPDGGNVQFASITDPDTDEYLGSRRVPRMGHFVGWQEWRHVVEGRLGHTSQR